MKLEGRWFLLDGRESKAMMLGELQTRHSCAIVAGGLGKRVPGWGHLVCGKDRL